MTTTITLGDISHPFTWEGEPRTAQIDETHALRITAGAKTDFFIDPAGQSEQGNAPRLMCSPDPQFTLSARVGVEFAATYDAGVLFLYVHPTCWAKLCFEFSPQQQPMIVSVVTNGRSDDCNSAVIQSLEVYLRVTRLGGAFAFHYSTDQAYWQLVRYFALDSTRDLRVGFLAQSPTGEACTATFSRIVYTPQAVQDIRSGM